MNFETPDTPLELQPTINLVPLRDWTNKPDMVVACPEEAALVEHRSTTNKDAETPTCRPALLVCEGVLRLCAHSKMEGLWTNYYRPFQFQQHDNVGA